MESYIFLESSLENILNAITFARIKMLHSSIITPSDLITSLQKALKSLVKSNLPLPTYSNYIANYINIIELKAFQSDSKLIFVFKIPLVKPEIYTLYRLHPIPILDNRTSVFQIFLTFKNRLRVMMIRYFTRYYYILYYLCSARLCCPSFKW